MKNYNVLFIALLGLFVACEKEDVDNTLPEITISNPVMEAEYHPGDTIHFDCLFTDNEALKSYKVDIHFAGDHEHKSVQLANNQWQYDKTWEFESGQTSVNVQHSEIVVPEMVTYDGTEEEITEGEYHFGVYCTDQSGNVNQEFIDIIIEHDDHDHDDEEK